MGGVIKLGESFGQYLRNLRKQAGLTLKELGKSTDLSYSYLSQLERGERGGVKKTPSPEILQKIARPLGISYEELMIKAGYWMESFDDQDRETFERIYNEKAAMLNRVGNMLSILSDEDGEFPDDLHKDIYSIFGDWLPRQYDGQWNYDDCFKVNSDDDELSEPSTDDFHEEFNLAYNRKNIMNGLKKYDGYTKTYEDILNKLIALADKFDYKIDERKSSFFEIDLNEILPDQSVIVRFNKKLISVSSRHKLIGYARALADADEMENNSE